MAFGFRLSAASGVFGPTRSGLGGLSLAAGSVVAPVPPAAPVLATLTLSAASFVAGAVAGTVIGTISGKTPGSSIAVTPNDGRLALSGNGTQLLVGMTASSAGTITATLTETLAGATGSPKATTVTLTVDAGVVVVPEIAWTPAMVGAFELWEAADPAGSLNAAGAQAAAGEAVATMVDRSGAGRNFTPVGAGSTDKPLMGAAGDASPSGVRPVLFRDPNAMRTAAFGTAYKDHTMIALVRLKAVTGTQDRWLVGLGDGSAGTNSEIKQSSGGVAGRL